jgi:hypothetical protein
VTALRQRLGRCWRRCGLHRLHRLTGLHRLHRLSGLHRQPRLPRLAGQQRQPRLPRLAGLHRLLLLLAAPLVLLSGVSACGGDADPAPGDAGPAGDAGLDSGTDPDAFTELDAGTGDAGTGDAGAGCPAAALGAQLGGRDRLLIGGSMSDDAFAAAPFDLRYHYLAGDVPSGGPCADCAQGCSVNGHPCDNAHGCEWWGCWQWDQEPPGRFVANFVADARSAGAVPMISYYIWFSVAGQVEGAPEIAALGQGDLVADLLADLRFLGEVLAEDPSGPVILHLEPDLWGYGHQVDSDPTQIPVALSAAADPACTGLGDHFAGFGRCLVAIARDTAPHALVGFHASAWGAGHDALAATDPAFDFTDHARRTALFLQAVGAADTDLVVVEMSDRDAGFNDRWWDPDNQTRPHFQQAIGWVSDLGDALGLAPLWWQVPYGHLGLENICDRYEDNRVDYVFDHPEQLAAGGALGVAFGAGAACMTTPDTDDGHFLARASQYFQGPRPPLCVP